MEKKNLSLKKQISNLKKEVKAVEGKVHLISILFEDPAKPACDFWEHIQKLKLLLLEVDSDEERNLLKEEIERKQWEYETIVYRVARMLTFEEIKNALEHPYKDFECFVLDDIMSEKINDMQNGKK